MRVDKRFKPARTLALLLVIGVVVGGALGFAGAVLRGVEYESTAQLIWDPSSTRYTNATAYVPDATSLGLQIKTQALTILSDDVIDPASETVGLTPSQLRGDVAASGSPDTNQLTITAKADSPSRARELASEVYEAYSDEVQRTFASQYREQASALQRSIDKLQLQVDATPSTSGSLADNLAAQLATLTTQQVVLRAQVSDAQTPLKLLREPVEPAASAGPGATTLAVVGAGLGFLLSLAVFGLVRSVVRARVAESDRVRSATPR